jgi:hypothetical protein
MMSYMTKTNFFILHSFFFSFEIKCIAIYPFIFIFKLIQFDNVLLDSLTLPMLDNDCFQLR